MSRDPIRMADLTDGASSEDEFMRAVIRAERTELPAEAKMAELSKRLGPMMTERTPVAPSAPLWRWLLWAGLVAGLAATFGGVSLALPEAQASLVHQHSGREVIVGLRPEDFHLSSERGQAVDLYVVAIEVLGPEVILVASPGHPGNAEIMIRCPRGFTAGPDARLTFHYDPHEIHLFDVATRQALPRPSQRG